MFPLAHFSFFFFFFFFISSGAEGSHHGRHNHHHGGSHNHHKLFVFGDSYADTGNWPKSTDAVSWKEPYGMSFPGNPSGRFSDGLILTDYIGLLLLLSIDIAKLVP